MKQIVRSLALGALLGAAWGVMARLWMRAITTTPEFSWSGTLMIVGFSALLGMGWGCAHLATLSGKRRWLWGFLPGHVLFMSPGLVMAPASLVGGLMFASKSWVVRLIGALAVLVPVAWTWSDARFDEVAFLPASTSHLVFLVAGMLVLDMGLALGSAQLWRGLLRRTAVPYGSQSGS